MYPFNAILVAIKEYILAIKNGLRYPKNLTTLSSAKEICKNVSYTGRLDLFSDFTHSTPENIDFFWTNIFYLKVNNWLNAVYSLDLAYDDDIKKFGYFKDHPALQSKSILGIGVSTQFGKKKNRMDKKVHDKM